MADPIEFIRNAPLGMRMTVRSKIDSGFTDAVGYLRECGDHECAIETRRALVRISLSDVTAVKEVPPERPRREPIRQVLE
jgi:hypothetical protein